MAELEPGFYWVNLGEGWVIGELVKNVFDDEELYWRYCDAGCEGQEGEIGQRLEPPE